jgi:hypothetical protein
MFTNKRFTTIAIMSIALMALVILPLNQAFADDYSKPATKTDNSSGQMKSSSPKSTMPDKPTIHKMALDGKSFTGKMNDPTDATKSYDETISFRNGKFHSSACDAYGFGEASYTVQKDKDMMEFTSTTTSNKDGHAGQMNWHGSIKGNELTATAEMVMDGKSQGTSTIKAMMETQTASKMK